MNPNKSPLFLVEAAWDYLLRFCAEMAMTRNMRMVILDIRDWENKGKKYRTNYDTLIHMLTNKRLSFIKPIIIWIMHLFF